MHRKCRQRILGQNGPTLLETLLTLSLVAVLLGIGLPTFQDQLAGGRARAVVEQLLAAAQFAQGTAQRLRRPVVLCPIKSPKRRCRSVKVILEALWEQY
jgi:Tfp pilus assembly protein FimT